MEMSPAEKLLRSGNSEAMTILLLTAFPPTVTRPEIEQLRGRLSGWRDWARTVLPTASRVKNVKARMSGLSRISISDDFGEQFDTAAEPHRGLPGRGNCTNRSQALQETAQASQTALLTHPQPLTRICNFVTPDWAKPSRQ